MSPRSAHTRFLTLSAATTVLLSLLVGTTSASQAATPTPQSDQAPTTLVVGRSATCATIQEDGTFCWGTDTGFGQLGRPVLAEDQGTSQVPSPIVPEASPGESTRYLDARTVRSVAGNGNTMCALDYNGFAYCWGEGATVGISGGPSPYKIPTLADPQVDVAFTTIDVGGDAMCGVSKAGPLYCWGPSATGAAGSVGPVLNPTVVALGSGPAAQSAASVSVSDFDIDANSYSCALSTVGDIWCWGDNHHGQLGTGAVATSVLTPTVIQDPIADSGWDAPWTAVSAGGAHACALDSSGQVFCWGDNSEKQLGDGTTTAASRPTLALGPDTNALVLDTISAGNYHTCGLESGAVWCWGNNSGYQTVPRAFQGASPDPSAQSPTELGGDLATNITAISSGLLTTCAADANGQIWCWGSNTSGHLGASPTLNLGKLPSAPALDVTLEQNATDITITVTPGARLARIEMLRNGTLVEPTPTGTVSGDSKVFHLTVGEAHFDKDVVVRTMADATGTLRTGWAANTLTVGDLGNSLAPTIRYQLSKSGTQPAMFVTLVNPNATKRGYTLSCTLQGVPVDLTTSGELNWIPVSTSMIGQVISCRATIRAEKYGWSDATTTPTTIVGPPTVSWRSKTVSRSKVTVRWVAVSPALGAGITNYKVYAYSTKNGRCYKLLSSKSTTGAYAVFTMPRRSTKYCFRVRSVSPLGYSPSSIGWIIKTG